MITAREIDRIVTDDKIATIEREDGFVEAMAICGDRIVAHGSTKDIRAVAPRAEVIDARGRTVIPGFIDSHCHPDMHGARLGR